MTSENSNILHICQIKHALSEFEIKNMLNEPIIDTYLLEDFFVVKNKKNKIVSLLHLMKAT